MGNVLGHESAAGILDAETIEDDLKWLAVREYRLFLVIYSRIAGTVENIAFVIHLMGQ